MLERELRQEMEQILPPERILYDEPMSRHCSFHTGGPADALAAVRTEEEMAALLSLLRSRGENFYLLGKGTNLLIGDGGFRGVIVTTVEPRERDAGGRTGLVGEADRTDAEEPFLLNALKVEENRILAGSGATLKAVATAAMERGLTGLEFAAGIPGTVGGGLVMNAGAFDGEMKQVVKQVKLLMPDGSFGTYGGEEMEFGYRTSMLRRIPATALRAEFVLTPGDPERIRARVAELAEKRREKQPLRYPSAGSTFKRPEGYFAGKLIMDAGLAGYSVGGAEVSRKHCGFIINRGGATSGDIRTLIKEVQDKVFGDTGVRLEPEVIFLGEF